MDGSTSLIRHNHRAVLIRENSFRRTSAACLIAH
jgi:hypothetical protein